MNNRVVLRQAPLRRCDRPLVAFCRDEREERAVKVLQLALAGHGIQIQRFDAQSPLRVSFSYAHSRSFVLGLLCGGRGKQSCEGPVLALQWPEDSTELMDHCSNNAMIPLRFDEGFHDRDPDMADCVYCRGHSLLWRTGRIATVLAVVPAGTDLALCTGALAMAIALGAKPELAGDALMREVKLWKTTAIPQKEFA